MLPGFAKFPRQLPALLLVAAEDEGGLHVFESRDAVETLGWFVERVSVGGGSSTGVLPGVIGVRAFVPEPFGVGDVPRVVRAVGGFDGRRRRRSLLSPMAERFRRGADKL